MLRVCVAMGMFCIATNTCRWVLLRIGYRCSQRVGGFQETTVCAINITRRVVGRYVLEIILILKMDAVCFLCVLSYRMSNTDHSQVTVYVLYVPRVSYLYALNIDRL
jgi:hypothetical protein